MKAEIKKLIQQVREDIARRKAMPEFGSSPDAATIRIKTFYATQRSFTVETVESLLSALENNPQAVSTRLDEKAAFDTWLAGDYSPDRSGATSEADEAAFLAILWHVWQARAALNGGS